MHYACYDRVKKNAFHAGRFNLFFYQLAHSNWMINARGTRFGVHVVLQDPRAIQTPWNQVLSSDFGTTSPDGSNRTPDNFPIRTGFDGNVFPYDMFTIPSDEAVQGVRRVTSPLMERGSEYIFQFVEQLKNATLQAMPENNDSGDPENARIVNLFLVVVHGILGGGGPRDGYWLTADAGGDEWILNPKALLTPKITDSQTCFWECLMVAMSIRMSFEEESYTESVDMWMKDMVVGRQATTRERQKQMDRIHWNVRAFLSFCGTHVPSCPTEWLEQAVDVGWTERIGELFRFESVTVLNEGCGGR